MIVYNDNSDNNNNQTVEKHDPINSINLVFWSRIHISGYIFSCYIFIVRIFSDAFSYCS